MKNSSAEGAGEFSVGAAVGAAEGGSEAGAGTSIVTVSPEP